MKKIIAIILASILIFGVCTVAFAKNQPAVPEGYIGIYTAEDLNNIRNDLAGKYILMNDIDLSVYESWEPIGTSETPFTGELDGNGYKIVNMCSQYGLMDYVNGALIENLGVINCNINSYINKKYVGIIANEAFNSVIENCYTSGSIFGTTGNGPLAVAYDFYPGGLVGYSDASSIKNSYSDVSFSLEYTVMYPYAAGGLAGKAINSEFVCCYATPEFDETFIGYGNTEGRDIYTGGLVGDNTYGNSFESCYFSDNSDFAVGTSAENPQGTKDLSYDALKIQASYEGFDFENVWTIEENGYAVLDFSKIKQCNPEEMSVDLVYAKIIKVPCKKRIVFGQLPESPEGIELELKYNDGSVITEKITVIEDEYYVNGEYIIAAEYAAVEKYGIKSAGLYLNEGNIHLSYKYLALPSIINFIANLFK